MSKLGTKHLHADLQEEATVRPALDEEAEQEQAGPSGQTAHALHLLFMKCVRRKGQHNKIACSVPAYPVDHISAS